MTLIQKPSKGRVVLFTAWRGQGPDARVIEAKRALTALSLEVPDAVHKDVVEKILPVLPHEKTIQS